MNYKKKNLEKNDRQFGAENLFKDSLSQKKVNYCNFCGGHKLGKYIIHC